MVGHKISCFDISIYRGILTGYNAAFIVDQATRDAIVEADPHSVDLLKPILRGRDIARYRANWAGIWLIDTHNGYSDVPPINVDDYPAVKAHLNQFFDHLRSRSDKGTTPYNLRNCAYHEEFSRNKLFWMHMSPYGRFALGEQGVMCNQKCFMITGQNLEYLCAVLNSTLVTWLVRQISVTTGMGLCQWDKFTVERVPVIQPDDSTITWFSEVVRKLLESMTDDSMLMTKQIQLEIDQAVLTMYGITNEEIGILYEKTNT